MIDYMTKAFKKRTVDVWFEYMSNPHITQKSLAMKYNISTTRISQLVERTWRYIKWFPDVFKLCMDHPLFTDMNIRKSFVPGDHELFEFLQHPKSREFTEFQDFYKHCKTILDEYTND